MALRAACMEGGVSVKPATPGGRVAMYRVAVEAAARVAMDMEAAATIGEDSPLRFVSAMAQVRPGAAAAALGLLWPCLHTPLRPGLSTGQAAPLHNRRSPRFV